MIRKRSPKKLALALSLLALSLVATSEKSYAQSASCIALSEITSWEVIGSRRILAYADKTNLAFVELDNTCPYLDRSKPLELRFFSPSICRFDVAVINGRDCKIQAVSRIRQN